MFYGCRGGILARVAPAPWGPWSAPTAILRVGPDVDCSLVMTLAGCNNRQDFWPALHKNGKLSIAAPFVPVIAALMCTTKRSVEGVRILDLLVHEKLK
jgi:hypothetical protein